MRHRGLILGLMISAALFLMLLVGVVIGISKAEARAADLPARPDHVFRFNPNEAVGPTADSDGRVPEYIVCGFRALGRYSFRETGDGEIEGVIRYNICAHKRIDHKVREWRETIEHERLHALGYKLGE